MQITCSRISPVLIRLFNRQTDWTIGTTAMFPVTDNLSGHTAVRHCTILANLTTHHMRQYVFHCFTIWQSARSHFAVWRLRLTSLALVRV